jgi:glycosyltransferase involved in cell wall biosynthesis
MQLVAGRTAQEYNRSKVEKMFTVERMAGEYKDLFEQVLSRR